MEVDDMEIEIKELKKRDVDKAIPFAVQGMHFEQYTENPTELCLYGKYFLYLELHRATQIYAAYMGDQLVGLLLADMKGEPKAFRSFWKKLYVKATDALMNLMFPHGSTAYDQTNAEMLRQFSKRAVPDGEICYLAADPALHGKGIGSRLLEELSRKNKGRLVYLYTDDNCTYQFYEHKGFDKSEERKIEIEIHKKRVPLTCYLYSKKLYP